MEDKEFWEEQIKTTEEFLTLCPQKIKSQVVSQVNQTLRSFYPDLKLPQKDKNYFETLIISNPILQRVIFYTYTPPEEIKIRKNMILVWESGLEKPTLISQNFSWGFNYDTGYIDFVLTYPEWKEVPLLKSFLIRLRNSASRVMNADVRKLAGAQGSIEELRENACREVVENGVTKLIVDQSPWYRIEQYIQRNEIHYYVLVDDPKAIEDIFETPDESLILLMQWAEDEKSLQESAYSGKTKVFVHNKAGQLVKRKGNPFPFALGPKYKPLRENIHGKYRLDRDVDWKTVIPGEKVSISLDPNDRRWDLEQIFRKAIMEWDGRIPPPAYFKKALEWGFKNLEKSFRKRFISKRDLQFGKDESFEDIGEEGFILKEDLDYSGGSLDKEIKDKEGNTIDFWVNLLEDDKKKSPEQTAIEGGIETELNRFMNTLENPIDKEIFLDLRDSCSKDDEKISSDAELARNLNIKGVDVTPQYIGKRRKNLKLKLQEHFKPYKD